MVTQKEIKNLFLQDLGLTKIFNELLEKIFDTIQDSIIIIDNTGIIKKHSNNVIKTFNIPSKSIEGWSIKKIFPNLDLHNNFKTVYQPSWSQKQFTIRIDSINSTNSEFYKILYIYDDDNKRQEKLSSNKDPDDAYNLRVYFRDLIGNSDEFLESLRWAKIAALSDSPVLLIGETGTGKELFARSIHYDGNRSRGPFIAQNCSAIPESLLEGLLFGTSKGAFTGAEDKKGIFEKASGGTLFLDEINSMSVDLQAKILRILDQKKVRRLGGSIVPVDTRIISSSNSDPLLAIEQGKLRSDLFYRLSVIQIEIPPLRKRTGDIELLTNFFIKKYNSQLRKNIKGISIELLQAFKEYSWPGNVRELQHCIECAINIAPYEEKYIKECHIPKYLKISHNMKVSENHNKKNSILDTVGKDEIKQKLISVLQQTNGNISKAANILGISRQNLQYHLKKHQIRKKDIRI